MTTPPCVAGLDVGGTKTNATLLDSKAVFLNNGMVETPSRVLEGPEAAIEAMAKAIELAIGDAGVHWESVRVIGLDTPGPASADGVISSKGSTNFSGKEWCGFDIRTAVEDFFKLPVVYNNDANAAALYAHQQALRRRIHSRSLLRFLCFFAAIPEVRTASKICVLSPYWLMKSRTLSIHIFGWSSNAS